MNILKQKAMELIERAIAKTGRVLDVRPWEPATIYEVDLHLPGTNMKAWQSVQHMKVKVGNMAYRDYSPAMWDADISTCTILVDAGHDGAGSSWVKQLKAGDTITYAGIAPTAHKPVASGQVFCVGDATSIGHFLALEQLSKPQQLSGVIAFQHDRHRAAFKKYFTTGLDAAVIDDNKQYAQLAAHLLPTQLTSETIFMAGNIPGMAQLRKLIKHQMHFKGSVKLQGFWS